ncbi:hypothetical protein [Pseudomonas syringae]|uniref:hypothetical protein n=1 Tax=Pseudomonas syringae TaxID=317 RepID=UPI001F103AF5|nr:hypothetical protein [Pseudomonas syringae]MCH5508840.1 hypothetical protein [Pseudomonas syringae pv. syringae]MCH5637657.1 hypothetical protein [Pseudomonas syringae pv. syringae]MCH7426790.1 hypothetical protein [Pseudomonas syringae pv. syringae]
MSTHEMTDAMKAEFIKAFQAKFGFGVLTASANDDAAAMMGAAAWAWQASREAVFIELPPEPGVPEAPEEAIDDSHMDAYHAAKRMRAECVKSIQATGTKVRS